MSDSGHLQRRLGLFSATTLVVGSMIGSGVFIVLSTMAGFVATPGLLIGLWVFGGLFTMLGAISCSELAAMFPRAGGQYVYLRQAYGDFWAFLFGWAQFLIVQTGVSAAVAIAFAKYLGALVPNLGEKTVLLALSDILPADTLAQLPEWLQHWGINSAQLVACGVVALLTVVNMRGVGHGAFVQNLFTVLKVAAIVALIVVGLSHIRSVDNFFPLIEPTLGPQAVGMGILAAMAVALSKALFAYDSWYTVTFVAEEIRDSHRTLPRALVLGCLLTTVLYLLTNVAYLGVMPINEIAAVKENRVAQYVAETLFGPVGSTMVIVAILISTFGCVNGLLLGGARVYYAMAREGLFFRRCANLNDRKVPMMALALQGIWTMVLTLTGSYTALLTFTTVASVFFGGLMVAAVCRLRFSQPDQPRPYRCWGYPLTPIVYLVICLTFLIYIVQGAPRETLIGTALVLTGIPFYRMWKWRRFQAAKELEAVADASP